MNLIGINFSCFQRKKENNQNGHDLITFIIILIRGFINQLIFQYR